MDNGHAYRRTSGQGKERRVFVAVVSLTVKLKNIERVDRVCNGWVGAGEVGEGL